MKKLAPVLSFLVAISTLQVFSYNYAFKNTTTTDLTVSIDIGLRFPVSFYIPAQKTSKGTIGGYCFLSTVVYPQSNKFRHKQYTLDIPDNQRCDNLMIKITKIGKDLKLERESF